MDNAQPHSQDSASRAFSALSFVQSLHWMELTLLLHVSHPQTSGAGKTDCHSLASRK